MTQPLAVVIGFIGKLPLAGMSLYNLHYIIGLQDLGYEVHYIERQNWPLECYDPKANVMTEDPSCALAYLEHLLPRYGIDHDHYSFIDQGNRCHGSGWKGLCCALDRADFLLTLCDPAWFEELERCPRRSFVDGDPVFTQLEMLGERGLKAEALKHYGTLFTYGTRIGRADCSIPTANRRWIPTRPVVATKIWDYESSIDPLPVTTVLNWSAGADVNYQGRVYGHKDRELERFINLPKSTKQSFVLAIGGNAPRKRLLGNGWLLADPLATTETVDSYQRFITQSRADFGIAKHAYVASRSGWFSDRSTCYLATGRPVLHQDTGCGEWLETGEGVLLFSDLPDVLRCLKRLDTDYEHHAKAARRVAEEYFEASKVVGQMLDDAGFR